MGLKPVSSHQLTPYQSPPPTLWIARRIPRFPSLEQASAILTSMAPQPARAVVSSLALPPSGSQTLALSRVPSDSMHGEFRLPILSVSSFNATTLDMSSTIASSTCSSSPNAQRLLHIGLWLLPCRTGL
ncbi:UNVERIFIED_CONTAM: hypothetical protein Slati_1469800 [Sesamum latifolium]|uniref:Uncharacterized protein n=1 Tax=Sesamum latifolium TaxID=2727402 RepID=A0AAW2X4T7_9LAMI